MKDLNKLFDECKAELDSIGIQYGNVVSIEVNYRAKKQCGLCREVRIGRTWEDNRYSINISSFLLADDVPDEGTKNTIIHELLHTCKDCMNHGGNWKRLAEKVHRKLGYNIKRTSSCEEKGLEGVIIKPQEYKYVFRCQQCGQEVKRKKKSKFTEYYTNYSCGLCVGKFKKVTHIKMM